MLMSGKMGETFVFIWIVQNLREKILVIHFWDNASNFENVLL